jgi:hypothetical protein
VALRTTRQPHDCRAVARDGADDLAADAWLPPRRHKVCEPARSGRLALRGTSSTTHDPHRGRRARRGWRVGYRPKAVSRPRRSSRHISTHNLGSSPEWAEQFVTSASPVLGADTRCARCQTVPPEPSTERPAWPSALASAVLVQRPVRPSICSRDDVSVRYGERFSS